MKKMTLILTALVLALSASAALAMNGQADRYNEARSLPDKQPPAKVVEVKAPPK